ncbi:MAG: hypothetical protein AAF715_29670 [Myxococcota bacterium]
MSVRQSSNSGRERAPRTTRQYLARYAQPEVDIAEAVSGAWSAAVVLPLLDETMAAVTRIAERLPSNALLVAVVNATEDRTPDEHESNATLLGALGVAKEKAFELVHVAGRDVLVIDRARPGRRFRRREGVGLARRIGLDLALKLRTEGRIEHPYLHTTDADASLPVGYPAMAARLSAAPRWSYPFWHETAAGEVGEATAAYELWLRYYVVGLRRAGSRYGDHCLGSTMAIEADHYAAVRGVPRRRGGEDFYLANKLRKLGPVVTPGTAPIRLQARRSRRVPFGTGPAVARLVATEELAVVHPNGFDDLREAHDALDRFVARGQPTRPRSSPARRAWDALDAPASLARIAASTVSSAARRTRVDDWFDAKRTLLFMHRVRDAGRGEVPWRDAMAAWGAPIEMMAARKWLAARDHGPQPSANGSSR